MKNKEKNAKQEI